MKVTSAIRAAPMPCADDKIICARRHVTTESLLRRTSLDFDTV